MFDREWIESLEGAEAVGPSVAAVVVDEPGAGVEGPDFVEVEVGDAKAIAAARVAREPRGDVGRSQQRFIVEDDWDTVPGQLDVELPGVGTGFPGQPRGLERILGRVERITPMGHDDRAVSERSQEREEPIRRSTWG